MPVDAAGNPYIIGPGGQFIPVNAQGQPINQPSNLNSNLSAFVSPAYAAQQAQSLYGSTPTSTPAASTGTSPSLTTQPNAQTQLPGAQTSLNGQNSAFPTNAAGWGSFSGNPTDPNAVAAYVQWLSQQPGADPTLASDPNYWIGKITSTGGLTSGNVGYWNGRSQAGAGNAGGAGGGQGSFPTPTPFTAPTLQDLLNSPDYQARLQAGSTVLQDSAAAQGTLLTGGTLQNLNQYAQTFASNAYNDLFNQALETNQSNFNQQLAANQNNYQQLYGLSSLGLSAAADQGNLASTYGSQIANLTTGSGNAQAAGTIGAGNAYAGIPTSLGNLGSYYALFNNAA